MTIVLHVESLLVGTVFGAFIGMSLADYYYRRDAK